MTQALDDHPGRGNRPSGYRRPLSHVIADSHLRDSAASWVLCECGKRLHAANARLASAAYNQHRRELGLHCPSLAATGGGRAWHG
jgi:hypothetical protein